MKSLFFVLTLLTVSVAFCCSLGPQSSWFWKTDKLIKKSDWIVVGRVKETVEKNGEIYLVIDSKEQLKNRYKNTEFKIGPFMKRDSQTEGIYRDVDCSPVVNVSSDKDYIFTSEIYNTNGIMPFSEKEKDRIAKLVMKFAKK